MSQERADDVTLFLKVFYETADELMNDMDTFHKGYLDYKFENGREYTEETAAAEIEARPLFTKETMEKDDYVLGTQYYLCRKNSSLRSE